VIYSPACIVYHNLKPRLCIIVTMVMMLHCFHGDDTSLLPWLLLKIFSGGLLKKWVNSQFKKTQAASVTMVTYSGAVQKFSCYHGILALFPW